MSRYLTENVIDNAKKYLRKNGLDFDEIKEKYPNLRSVKFKYLLQVCKYEVENSDIIDEINDTTNKPYCAVLNDILYVLYKLPELNDSLESNFANKSDDFVIDKEATKKRIEKGNKSNPVYAKDKNGNKFKRTPTLDELITKFAPYIEKVREEEKNGISDFGDENVGDYTVVPIYSFNRLTNDEYKKYGISETVNGYPTYSSNYEDYTSWCLTKSTYYFKDYTKSKNQMLYILLKNGWEDITPSNKPDILDDYGKSMFAVLIDNEGNINSITSRWNHEHNSTKRNSEHILNVSELCELTKFNVHSLVKYDEIVENIDIDDYTIEEHIGAMFEKLYIVKSKKNGLFNILYVDDDDDASEYFAIDYEEDYIIKKYEVINNGTEKIVICKFNNDNYIHVFVTGYFKWAPPYEEYYTDYVKNIDIYDYCEEFTPEYLCEVLEDYLGEMYLETEDDELDTPFSYIETDDFNILVYRNDDGVNIFPYFLDYIEDPVMDTDDRIYATIGYKDKVFYADNNGKLYDEGDIIIKEEGYDEDNYDENGNEYENEDDEDIDESLIKNNKSLNEAIDLMKRLKYL